MSARSHYLLGALSGVLAPPSDSEGTERSVPSSVYQSPPTTVTCVPDIARVETPLITGLAAAMLHLEHLAETAGTPEEETALHSQPVTLEQHRSYVLDNARRIRAALDAITATYEAPPADGDHARPNAQLDRSPEHQR
ncbi:hypothetical protein ACFV3E_36635 [Streptomyces sp. NPDC059718]